jgi:hypothetical protein
MNNLKTSPASPSQKPSGGEDAGSLSDFCGEYDARKARLVLTNSPPLDKFGFSF